MQENKNDCGQNRIELIDECFLFQLKKTEAVYDETLNSVKESFPQYIQELEGVANGAGVEFHKVSLKKKY